MGAAGRETPSTVAALGEVFEPDWLVYFSG